MAEAARALTRASQTTLSLAQRREHAQSILSQETTETNGLKAAKALLSNWPNARLDNPEHFYQALGRVFEQYPLQVCRDCADPVRGLAKTSEWVPTIAKVTAWCDTRLAIYQGLSRAQDPQEQVEKHYSEEHRGEMLAKLADLFHSISRRGDENDPILKLKREWREARKTGETDAA